MSQTMPQVAGTDTTEESLGAPRVRILLTAVDDADLDAALATIRRQVYEPSPDIVLVGGETDGVDSSSSLEEAISSTDSSFDYLWLLHADARPRPDALGALIAEIERNEASLAGSKLLKAGTMDELESVGGATDVFGEPYSGLDEGEIDLQQYDVVREVAFVQSASMLVRRDLAQGLKGLDPLLPPVAAGLDFSQRTRLAGGRVISVPSSEVYHQARCGERGRGWREQAGRLRAMLIAYSPLTLLWVVPYDLLVSIADSLASLLLLRWRPLVRHVYSWAWNLYHLPSTIKQRRRLRTVRSEGDEELFRFHAKGSVRLRAIGEEISGRFLSMFDDDQALARSTRRIWGSPGVWGAIVAAGIALLSARSIIFGAMPSTGFTFPFEPPSIALLRWWASWNEAGLGAGAAVHPSVAINGLVSFLWFGAEGAARTLLTIALSLVGIVGMGRLGGRLGLRGPGRYLAGLVVVAGPGTAILLARGSWTALGAAALLPWAVRAVFTHPRETGRSRLNRVGWALLTGALVAFFSPLLALVPIVIVVLWRAFGGERASLLLGLGAAAGGVVGLAFVVGDAGWVTESARRLGVRSEDVWPILILLAAVPLILVDDSRARRIAMTGGILSLAALTVGRVFALAPGLEQPMFVVASFGAALATAAALDSFSRNVFRISAIAGGVALMLMSIVSMGNGRLGLPAGDDNARLSFATTLSDDSDPGRILYASLERDEIPGEARPGPGFWYRVLDGAGTTNDEAWLPGPRSGDVELDGALTDIASGAELRPGDRLAQFGIEWVVLEGPSFRLDEVLIAQLDLLPLPVDPESRVFENDAALPIAGTDDVSWDDSGIGFAGESVEGPVGLAVNFDEGWQPDATRSRWSVVVDGGEGSATYGPSDANRWLTGAAAAVVLASLGLIIVGRRRR